MPERELKLNQLPGQSKQESRLLLEEHSHCEIPAGCGGVVLRWRNPETGMPVRLWLLSPGKYEMFLDGVPMNSNRPIISFGRHLLSLRFTEATAGQGLFMFAAHFCPTPSLDRNAPLNPRQTLLSQPDGSWRHCVGDPSSDAWRSLDFDDSRWTPLIRRPLVKPAENEYARRHQYEMLTKLAAEPLGSGRPGDVVCVRRVIHLTRECFESR
ncbi:MAG: hypothetical protein ABSH20_18450 [Tepidisphaeraceae bacterium]|jgi:hypothetical protein